MGEVAHLCQLLVKVRLVDGSHPLAQWLLEVHHHLELAAICQIGPGYQRLYRVAIIQLLQLLDLRTHVELHLRDLLVAVVVREVLSRVPDPFQFVDMNVKVLRM